MNREVNREAARERSPLAAPGSGPTEGSAVTGVKEVCRLDLLATGKKKAYCDDRPWEIGV
jgi:hypothetical protein